MKNGPIFIIIFIILVIGVELYFYFQERPEAVIQVEKTSQSIPICTVAGTALNFDGTNWLCKCVNGIDNLGKCIIGKDKPSTIINIGARAASTSMMNIPQCAAPGGLLSYDKKWKCTCAPGYSGADCSKYKGVVAGSSSGNMNMQVPKCYAPGGIFSYNGTDWTCVCTRGWTGDACDIFDSANAPVFIPNVPTCLPPGGNLGYDGTNWVCNCAKGWFGNDCAQAVPGTDIPCENGTLKYDNGVFKCECYSNYTGCDCSLPSATATLSQVITTCF